MKQGHWNQVLPVAYNIDKMISTHENCIYQNIKMEYILSKKIRKCRRKSEREEWTIRKNDIYLLD